MKFPQASCKYFPILALAVFSTHVFAADVELAGVGNFHKINEHVYRGAQPTDEGFRNLANVGVKTIIDLRLPGEHATDAEERAVKAAGMRYINIPMQGVVSPNEESIAKALKLMTTSASCSSAPSSSSAGRLAKEKIRLRSGRRIAA